MLEKSFQRAEREGFMEMVCPAINLGCCTQGHSKSSKVGISVRPGQTTSLLRGQNRGTHGVAVHTNTYRQSYVSNCLALGGLQVTWIAIIMAGKPTCPIYVRDCYTPLQSSRQYAGVGLFLCQDFLQTNVFIRCLKFSVAVMTRAGIILWLSN